MTRLTTLALVIASLTGCLVGGDAPSDVDPVEPAAPLDDVVYPGDPGTQLIPPGKIGIVLAHGFGGSGESFDPAIVQAIEANGHVVLRAEVPSLDGVEVRGAALGAQIDQFVLATGATKIHVIAHSMGGLDARYAISKLGYADRVASLTTISTPHRGTPLADVALGITSSSSASQQEALEAIADLLGVPVDSEALQRALVDLSEAQAPAFNAATVDAPGVKYFSYAGFATPGGIDNPNASAACAAAATPMPEPDQTRAALLLAAPIVAKGTERHPNDGVVAVDSARWAEFLGCIPADHLDESAVREDGDTTTVDTVELYRALAEKLALL